MTSLDLYNFNLKIQPPIEYLIPTTTQIDCYTALVCYQGRKGKRVGQPFPLGVYI